MGEFWKHLKDSQVGDGAFILLTFAAGMCLASFAISGIYWFAVVVLVWSLIQLSVLIALGIKRANIHESYFWTVSIPPAILGLSTFFGRMAATNETQLIALGAAIGVALLGFFIWLHLPSRPRRRR
jgi:hypothetical protein